MPRPLFAEDNEFISLKEVEDSTGMARTRALSSCAQPRSQVSTAASVLTTCQNQRKFDRGLQTFDTKKQFASFSTTQHDFETTFGDGDAEDEKRPGDATCSRRCKLSCLLPLRVAHSSVALRVPGV